MKKVLIPTVLLLAVTFVSFGQKAPAPPAKEKEQNIIIRKKGDKNEKMTIVIDGDKVTINGKPVEDYKDGDVEIRQDIDSDNDFPSTPPPLITPLPPLPPADIHGGSKMFIRDFNYAKHYNSAFLGVYSSSDEDGATISTVTKNSPAEKAGLKAGDVITKIGSNNIDDADDLIETVGKHKPEDKVVITYKRDKKENTVTVTLNKNKEQNEMWGNDGNHISMNGLRNFAFSWDSNKPRMGMRVQDVESGTGVKILNIDDADSPAAKAGLKEDDVITQVNGKNIATVKDINDAVEDAKAGDDIKITYQRSGTLQTATVHLPKPLQTSDL